MSASLRESAEWTEVKPKIKRSSPKRQSANPAPVAKEKQLYTYKNPSTISTNIDAGSKEYAEALAIVQEISGLPFDDWTLLTEAEYYVLDQRLIAIGQQPHYCSYLTSTKYVIAQNTDVKIIKPTCSVNYDSTIITNESETKNNSTETEAKTEDNVATEVEIDTEIDNTNFELPNRIALLRDWLDHEAYQQIDPDTNEMVSEWRAVWKSKQLDVFSTDNGFWACVDNDNVKLYLTGAMQGKGKIADELYGKITDVRSAETNKIVADYNNLHPVWAFVKVDKSVVDDSKIDIPFIKRQINNQDGSHTIRNTNTIDVNLKDTEENRQNNIYALSTDFSPAYINDLIVNFINGSLPVGVAAVIFNKTIALDYSKNKAHPGFRVRLLTHDDTPETLTECYNYLSKEFVDYNPCVVRICVPDSIKGVVTGRKNTGRNNDNQKSGRGGYNNRANTGYRQAAPTRGGYGHSQSGSKTNNQTGSKSNSQSGSKSYNQTGSKSYRNNY